MAPGSNKTISSTFPVLEMSCAACALNVETILKSTSGVSQASVNYASHSATIQFNPTVVSPVQLQAAVQSIGYDLLIESTPKDVSDRNTLHLKSAALRAWSTSLLAIPVIILGMWFMDWKPGQLISMGISALVFWFGRQYFINAFRLIRHRMVNMDTLVALSTGIAFIYSSFTTLNPAFWESGGLHAHVYFEAAVTIIAFVSIGKYLEERATTATTNALKNLIGQQPDMVQVLTAEGEKTILTREVQPGDVIRAHPGEKIAVDGRITSGTTYINESMISGEPVPVEKSVGQLVYAGTINQNGSITYEAVKVGADTVLGQIIKMVELARDSKAPVQKLVDKVAAVFVPTVLAIALLTAIVWIAFGGENAGSQALLTSITVLVIACPCALGLATPTALMVGLGKAAQNNLLIRNAEALELAHKVTAVVLDKTGTITMGKPVVTEIRWLEDEHQELYKRLLYTLELKSGHPLARAVVQHLLPATGEDIELDQFTNLAGFGVKAVWNDQALYAGNLQLMNSSGIEISPALHDFANQLEETGHTLLYAALNKIGFVVIGIRDPIKPGSAEAIHQLQQRGIEVHLLTGDTLAAAELVARETGITHVRASMLPGDKADYVKALQETHVVAVAGDGINDTQAMAQADVSIAMGRGTDIAMDVAMLTLITSDLRSIPKALSLSKATIRTIRQNLFWAFIYNLIGIPLAAGVLYPVNGFLLNPMIAGAAMALSSVSVVLNSLRLKYST